MTGGVRKTNGVGEVDKKMWIKDARYEENKLSGKNELCKKDEQTNYAGGTARTARRTNRPCGNDKWGEKKSQSEREFSNKVRYKSELWVKTGLNDHV